MITGPFIDKSKLSHSEDIFEWVIANFHNSAMQQIIFGIFIFYFHVYNWVIII